MNGSNNNTEFCHCGSEMVNEHGLLSNVLNEGQDKNHTYDDLLNGTLALQKNIINISRKNMENHSKFSWAQDGLSDHRNLGQHSLFPLSHLDTTYVQIL